jgi:hypothetical protein
MYILTYVARMEPKSGAGQWRPRTPIRTADALRDAMNATAVCCCLLSGRSVGAHTASLHWLPPGPQRNRRCTKAVSRWPSDRRP